MKKTAIILGASGLTGGLLLKRLIADPDYEKIKVFTRSEVSVSSEKIESHTIDMFQLDREKDRFTADVVFCCIGTTKAKTPDKNTYRKIDYGIPVAAAALSKENNIPKFIVISSLGANVHSSVFYSKTKGEMERDVLRHSIPETYILRPSLIVGNRKENRLGENIGIFFFKLFGFFIPKKYKAINAETIAKAMQALAKSGYSEKIISSEKIRELGAKTVK